MASVIDGSDNFDSGHDLGVGQTWQDLVASRSLSTEYVNTTGKPIQINITTNYGSGSNFQLFVDTIRVWFIASYSTNSTSASMLIPSGSIYRVELGGGGTISNWSELRGD